ncbi:MAG: hypothetical protein K2X47_08805 [Bdellovibrionales bacterium]|nr:hypothetical protein [Bdellovibrionales bacterium]
MNSHHLSLREIRIKYPFAQNLGEVLDFIQKDLVEVKEVVCGFTVNGMAFDESDESRLKACSIDEIQNISIRSSTIQSLIGESLKTGLQYVGHLQLSIEGLSLEFRSGDRKKAFEELKTFSEGLHTIFDLMRYVQRLGRLSVDEAHEMESRFLKMMASLLPAVEKRDFIFVADLLEYEVSAILAEIGGIFSDHVHHQESHGSNDPNPGKAL